MLPAIRCVPLVELGRIDLGVRTGLRFLPRRRRRFQAAQGRRGRGRSQELASLHLPRRIRAIHLPIPLFEPSGCLRHSEPMLRMSDTS